MAKKFIFCDLHIGHKDANCAVIDEAIKYVRAFKSEGDEVLGLGDWFHIDDGVGVDRCLNEHVTKELIKLAHDISIELTLGNHDEKLKSKAQRFYPIKIVDPFDKNGILYKHGHEFDPLCKVPEWLRWLGGKFFGKKTPGVLKGEAPEYTYLMHCHHIHSKAIEDLLDKKKSSKNYKGIVLGHTHLPLLQESPDMPFLLNGGDMRDSLTFIVQDNNVFHLMHWNKAKKQWQKMSDLII